MELIIYNLENTSDKIYIITNENEIKNSLYENLYRKSILNNIDYEVRELTINKDNSYDFKLIFNKKSVYYYKGVK